MSTMERATKYRQAIDRKIHLLITIGKSELEESSVERIEETVLDIETLANAYGLSDNNIANLINIILNPTNSRIFRNSVKSKLINSLYPINAISSDVIIKVVGSIGINSTRQKKLERAFIHRTLQVKLIKWLYLNIAINNIEGFVVIQKLAPMIFNLVQIEYTLQWVCLILFKIIIQANSKKCFLRNFIKKWRLDLLLQLNSKLDDQYLLLLIITFQDLIADANINYKLKVSKAIKDKNVTSSVFKYPNTKYLLTLINLKKNNGMSVTLDDEFMENIAYSLQTMISHKKIFEDKRRKLNPTENNEATNDLVNTIESYTGNYSIDEFIEHYNEMRAPLQLGAMILKFSDLKQNIVQLGDDLQIATIDTGIYQYLFLCEDLIDELDKWCEVVLVDEDSQSIIITESNYKLIEKIVKGVTNIQTITGAIYPITYQILNGQVKIINQTDRLVIDKFKLMRQLTLNNKFVDLITSFNWQQDPEIICSTLRATASVISKSRDYNLVNKVYSVVLEAIPNVLIKNKFSVSIELETVSFLRTLTNVPFSEIEVSNLILSPGLCYFLLLSNNAFVISEVCKHISFTKNYFAEYYSLLLKDKDDQYIAKMTNFKNLHNSYVMDICNLFWRDKALDINLNSSSKAMLLPPQFLNKIQNMTMTVEDDLKIPNFFKKSFNLLLHPAFSNIVINIVRQLEDSKACDIRYVGPIEETNFKEFITELGSNKWIGTTQFLEFKVMILKELDKTDFNGVSGFLFNSLKSLLTKR